MQRKCSFVNVARFFFKIFKICFFLCCVPFKRFSYKVLCLYNYSMILHKFFNIIISINIRIFNNSQKLIMNTFTTHFYLIINTGTIQAPMTIPKLFKPNISGLKETFSQNIGFPKNATEIIFLSKVTPSTIIWCYTIFFNQPPESLWSEHFRTLFINTHSILGLICM